MVKPAGEHTSKGEASTREDFGQSAGDRTPTALETALDPPNGANAESRANSQDDSAYDDDDGARRSCIRALTPSRRIEVPEGQTALDDGEDYPVASDDTRGRGVPSDLLAVESYRSLPAVSVWPDLDDWGRDEPRTSVDDAPPTIRQSTFVPSEEDGFDDRIRDYLDATREAAERHLMRAPKKRER